MDAGLKWRLPERTTGLLAILVIVPRLLLADPVVELQKPVEDPVHAADDLWARPIAIRAPEMMCIRPLQLTLTEEELRAFVDRQLANPDLGMNGHLEEILVTAPVELLPMHDITQEVWGGLAAPVWALLNPTQAWRILMPIPEQ
jgi:hypothetical protein